MLTHPPPSVVLSNEATVSHLPQIADPKQTDVTKQNDMKGAHNFLAEETKASAASLSTPTCERDKCPAENLLVAECTPPLGVRLP